MIFKIFIIYLKYKIKYIYILKIENIIKNIIILKELK